ncbi:MAG: PKD domain-containing protein [Chitinophagaceae bacterium]
MSAMKLTSKLLAIFLLISSVGAAQNWVQTGPVNFPVNVSGQINGIGRVTQIKFHPSLPNKLYVTSASGGAYSSNDNGNSWTLLNTDKFPATACASICIDHSNDQILYLATGDPNYYGGGFGIYKTVDAGANWLPANTGIGTRMALEMLMDPADHQVLVAVTNDGIWRTSNGGASWTNVKSGGAFEDLKRRPNTNTLFATTASQLWTSTDFGLSWTQVTSGLVIPAGTNGMRIGVSAADNNIVYLLANGNNGVLFKSVNAGTSFSLVYSSATQCIVCYNSDPLSTGQGNYNLGMCADPFDANHIYVVAHCLWESNNGGTSFQQKTEWYAILHTDHHQVEVNPYDANQLWNVNDGGVWKRRGTNDSLWDPKSDGVGATEIYQAGQSQVDKKIISIGTQDNGELFYDGIWKTNRGGDWGSRVQFDYSPESTIYYLEAGERRSFSPYGGSTTYNSPFAPTNNSRIGFHPGLPNAAILARDSLFISNSLNTAAPVWTNIFSSTTAIRDLCISSADSTIAYAVENGSRFIRVTNCWGTPVTTVYTIPNSSSSRGSVAAVKSNVNVVYVSANGKIYRTPDQGATWQDITYNLPGTNILKIYHDDFSANETVYVCTANKVYTKNNAAVQWTDISVNLPSIANVTDFMIFNNGTVASKLRISYYGRGVWEYAMHPNFPPVSNFSANKTYICPGQSIQYTDESDGNNLTYAWTFSGGTPAVSTAQNPLVSYSAAGIYSVSLTVTNSNGSQVKTKSNYVVVGTGTPQLITEGFQGVTYPPLAWTLQDAGNDGLNWYRSNLAGGFGNSSKSIAFDNYNNDTQGNKDQIRVPVLDMRGFSSARLTFDVAYAPYSTNSYLDSLLIGVSSDCGANFTYLYTKFGTSLATAPVNTGSTFVPTASQWRTDTIFLNNYLTNSNLLIAFENRGQFGQQLFIDNINLQLNPLAKFTALDSAGCMGTVIRYTDQSTGLVNSWSWTFAGGTPASSNLQNPTVSYASPGTFDVSLVVSNGSGTQTKTKSAFIKIYPAPTPVITNASNNLLSCSSAVTYQWYNENVLMAGMVQQTYQALKNGNYSVKVTDANGCAGSSAPFIVSGIADAVLIYPNPAGNTVYIGSNNISGKAELKIFAFSGALVVDQIIDDLMGRHPIDLRQLAAGIYEIKLVTEKGIFLKRLHHTGK